MGLVNREAPETPWSTPPRRASGPIEPMRGADCDPVCRWIGRAAIAAGALAILIFAGRAIATLIFNLWTGHL
jgi:hypothetical protein